MTEFHNTLAPYGKRNKWYVSIERTVYRTSATILKRLPVNTSFFKLFTIAFCCSIFHESSSLFFFRFRFRIFPICIIFSQRRLTILCLTTFENHESWIFTEKFLSSSAKHKLFLELVIKVYSTPANIINRTFRMNADGPASLYRSSCLFEVMIWC